MRTHKLWIDGNWRESAGGERQELRSPYSGTAVSKVEYASAEQLDEALAAAAASATALRKTSRSARSQLLSAMVHAIGARRQEFRELLITEAGKPVALAEAEINRAISTFTAAAEEVKRFGGEVVPIDVDPSATQFAPAVSYWVPRGVVLAITPFNFPLNLVAHKVAPALAAGCPVVLKPAPQAPGPAHLLAEVFEQAARSVAASAVPAGDAIPLAAFQVLSCSNEVVGAALTDPRVATVSFTGSTRVGWLIQSRAAGKRVLLELGGNAAVIVHRDGDLQRAAKRIAAGGFGYAGQSCISVQRIFVEESVRGAFTEALLSETAKIKSGDPANPEVTVGPLIDALAASRVMEWVEEAKTHGARLLAGGTRAGNVIAPTIITEVEPSLRVACEEVFGPVVVLQAYDRFEKAIQAVNASKYGLQAGVFTDSSQLIQQAIENLEVGGVIINEVPTFRSDQMPYGGVKQSGLGREGVRYAMEEYSERRTVVRWKGH